MNAPKLRFPSFAESGDRMESTLGELVTIRSGTSPSNFDLKEAGLYPFFKVEELNNCEKYQEKSRTYSDTNKGAIPKDSIIFPKRGAAIMTNKVRIAKQESLMDSNLMALIPAKEKLSHEYLYQFLLKEELHRIADTSTIPQINNKHIEPLKISLPSIQEQQKIASFLSAVDQKISLLTKKHDLLVQYKKGVMQKIFNQEIRFKDKGGKDFPGWENIPLSKILFERNELLEKDKGLEHVSLTVNGVVPKSNRYERDFLVNTDNKKYKVTRLGDICYNPANLKFGVISRNTYKDGVFSPIYVTFEVREQNLNFIDILLTRWDFINAALKYQQGTVYERMAVKPQDLLSILVEIPCLQEQEKIASFLGSIKQKIESLSSQLEQTKQYKQGLLQQMFI